MSVPDRNKLLEALRSGRVSAEVVEELELHLARDTEFQAVAHEELALNQAVRALPDVPVSTNFTARVVAAALADSARSRAVGWSWMRPSWLPKFATVSLALGLALASYRYHEVTTRRELARSLAEVSSLAERASPDLLQDFEAIQRLDAVPQSVDRELIAALQ